VRRAVGSSCATPSPNSSTRSGTRTAVPEWVDAIGRGSLLIVDEAGMAATLDLAAVVDFAGERGASVRLWRPDLGEFGKLHVRHGKGSRGRGPKSRLVPAINGADRLIDWWLAEVRHQFGGDWSHPDAAMLPSERRDPDYERCGRVGDDQLRHGLRVQTQRWLPVWSGRLTPHVLRHYCASSLYGAGMDIRARQELLGHEWLSTTTQYVHVHDDHVERSWLNANRRLETRFAGKV
jgi:integrase/recombinase XerC